MEGESCLYVPRRLDKRWLSKALFDNNRRVSVRTFVFHGGPELGQFGSVRPIKVRLQMKGWAVRPTGISDRYLGSILTNSSKTSKSYIGRINDRREDKVCGEQD